MSSLDVDTCLFYGIIILTFVVIATIIALLVHSGLFTSLEIKTCNPTVGQIRVAYKCGKGSYKNSGLLFTEIHTLLPQYRTLGVYYDDPRKKEERHLRYIVGLILGENEASVKPDEEALLTEKEFKFVTFPSINHVVETSFPFNSTLSVIMAVFRVYPALNEYITERNLCAYPFIEVYDNEKDRMFFYAPLEKQNQFYVPEVLDDDRQKTDDDTQSSLSYDDSVSLLQGDGSICDSESTNEISSCSFDQEIRSSSSIHPSVNESNFGMEVVDSFVQNNDTDVIPEDTKESIQKESPENICKCEFNDQDKDEDFVGVTNNLDKSLSGSFIEKRDDSDSDNNTISSFEEIEDSDLADMPVKDNAPE